MKVVLRTNEPASRGGQASLSLFGVPGFEAPQQSLPHRSRPSRIKVALNSFDSDGLSAAHYRRPSALTPASQTALDNEPEFAHNRWLADLAETRGCPFDEEEAAYTRSFADVGYTEHLMALER